MLYDTKLKIKGKEHKEDEDKSVNLTKESLDSFKEEPKVNNLLKSSILRHTTAIEPSPSFNIALLAH